MSDSSKKKVNLQHHLSTGEPASKVLLSETSESNPKDYAGFWWHKGNPKLIAQHKERYRHNKILRELKESQHSLVSFSKHLEQATLKDKAKISHELKDGIELLYFVLRNIEAKLVEVQA